MTDISFETSETSSDTSSSDFSISNKINISK